MLQCLFLIVAFVSVCNKTYLTKGVPPSVKCLICGK